MVLPFRSATDWMVSPVSTTYRTPRVLTAPTAILPSVLLYSTEARLQGTAAASSSPLPMAAVISSAVAARVNSYWLAEEPASLSSKSLTKPMVVGPLRAARRMVVRWVWELGELEELEESPLLLHPAKTERESTAASARERIFCGVFININLLSCKIIRFPRWEWNKLNIPQKSITCQRKGWANLK